MLSIYLERLDFVIEQERKEQREKQLLGSMGTIGAGSVVTKDILANCVAVGNPCRVIRKINEEC